MPFNTGQVADSRGDMIEMVFPGINRIDELTMALPHLFGWAIYSSEIGARKTSRVGHNDEVLRMEKQS